MAQYAKTCVAVLSTAVTLTSPLTLHAAGDGDLAGGGTFIRNSSIELNSALSLTIQNIDRENTTSQQEDLSGTVLLSSITQADTSAGIETRRARHRDAAANAHTQFLSKFEITCLRLLDVGPKGDYDMILKGIKVDGSKIRFKNRPVCKNRSPRCGSDKKATFTREVDVSGDEIIGRLTRRNGLVERNDWSTGFENCAGFGQSSLSVQGDGTKRAFKKCSNAIEAGIYTTLPDCDEYSEIVDEGDDSPDVGPIPVDRSLAGDVKFTDAH